MTRSRVILSVAAAALLLSGGAIAGEIYKWVDENGNVHYEDRPLGETEITRLDIRSRPTDNAAVEARLAAQRESRALHDQVASEAPPDMSQEEIRAEQKEREQKCQMYRDRLEAFLRSTRLYEEGDDGERKYLDEEQTLAARSRVEKQIKQYCGS